MSTPDHPDWWRPVGGSNAIDAVLERRSLISNNGSTPTWRAGHVVISRGKFFSRGMRGWLESVEMYCQDTAAAGGNIIINIAPYPGAGILHTRTIIVPVGGAPAWRATNFRLFWNYDAMFIWWYCVTVAVQYAYDVELPWDGWRGRLYVYDWLPDPERPWVRANMAGETPGDVPVSGTLNVVPIPNMVSDMDGVTLTINGPGLDDIIESGVAPAGNPILGMGQLTCLMMTLNEILGAVPDTAMEIHIVTDGVDRMYTVAEIRAAISDVVNTPTPISMGIITPATNTYQVSFSLKFPFRTSLRVYVENTALAGNNMTVDAIYAYELLA